MGPLVSLILPAFNEVKRIEQTLRESVEYFEARGLTFEIIVSADGNDGTRERVQALGLSDPRIQAMGQVERRGKGNGIRIAVHRAAGEYIGFMDADNKTPISQFDLVLPLLQAGAPVVIGSRAQPHSTIEVQAPLHRRLGSLGFRRIMQVITGLTEITDSQCGFKFFERSVAKRLFSLQRIDGYMFDVEILYLATKLAIPIRQVPVKWRADGDSRLALFRNNLQNLIDLFRIRLGKRETGPC